MAKIFVLIFLIAIAVALGYIYFIRSGNYLNEENTVRQYLSENADNIVAKKPTLGGKWHLAELILNKSQNSGQAIFEDGHVQVIKQFSYDQDYQGRLSIFKFR